MKSGRNREIQLINPRDLIKISCNLIASLYIFNSLSDDENAIASTASTSTATDKSKPATSRKNRPHRR